MTLKITDIAQKYKTHSDWLSDPFYTDAMGYRLCLWVDFGGDFCYNDSHCAIYLRLMQGRYDAGLHWPLNIELQVTILNQICDDQHCSHTVDFLKAVCEQNVTHRVFHSEMAESAWGYWDFISYENLCRVTSTCQFLKDDCIFVEVCTM